MLCGLAYASNDHYGLFESVQKLEKHMIIDVPPQVFEEVTDVTASAAKMGMEVGWMDEAFGKIANKKKHLDLLSISKELTKEMEQIDHQRNEITQILPEIDVKYVYNDFSFHQVKSYRVKVLNRKK